MYIHPIFHVPHDGDGFPQELMSSVCVPREQFLRCHEKMRDSGAARMVPFRFRGPDHLALFPVSRLLCDVERFIGPGEIMERYGMGFCYERSFDGSRIKNVDAALLARTRVYYDRHHRLLDDLCGPYENVFLVDLHSFSCDIVPAAFLSPGRDMPDVCVGADPAFSDPGAVAAAEDIFRQAGFSTAVNYPYSGCMTPDRVLAGEFCVRFSGLMLEFNKSVYFEGGRPSPRRLELLRELVDRLVTRIDAIMAGR